MGRTYTVTYKNGPLTITEPFDTEKTDIDVFFDAGSFPQIDEEYFCEIIKENGFYDDLICEALCKYDAEFKDDGTIDIDEIGENLYFYGKKYLEECDVCMSVEVLTDGKHEKMISVDVISCLKKLLDERSDCEVSYIDIGECIEGLLFSFTKKATWNVGFISGTGEIISIDALIDTTSNEGITVWKQNDRVVFPVIWYGATNKIMKLWAIDSNTTQKSLQFWFNIDIDESMHDIVPDCDETFCIWYFLESGREFPNLSEIMEQCPIAFSPDDSTEIIQSKIEKFFLSATASNNDKAVGIQ